MKIRIAIFLTFVFVFAAGMFAQCPSAQQTTVTFTLTDSDTQIWSNAKVTANLYNPSQTQKPLCASTNHTFPISVTATTNGSGVGSMVLTGNSAITPPGTRWIFTIQSNTSALPTITTPLLVQTGGTQNFTSTLSGLLVAPRFQAIAGSYGYSATEAVPNPCVPFVEQGNLPTPQWVSVLDVTPQFLNVVSNQVLVCEGGSYVPPASSFNTQTDTVNNHDQTGINFTDTPSIGWTNPTGRLEEATVLSVPPSALNLFGDGYITITPNTPSPGDTTIGHQKLDQLDTPNTHSTGTQVIESGNPSTVAQVIQGNGVVTPGFISVGTGNTGPGVSNVVAVGETEIDVTTDCHDGFPVSSLGNTRNGPVTIPQVSGGGENCIFWWRVTNPGTDVITGGSGSFYQVSVWSNLDATTPVDVSIGQNNGSLPIPGPVPSAGTFSVTTTTANETLFQYIFTSSADTTLSFTTPASYTNIFSGRDGVSNFNQNGGTFVQASVGASVPISWSGTISVPSNIFGVSGLLALHPSSTFVQGTDLVRNEDSSGGMLSGIDKLGRQVLLQNAAAPSDTPNTNPRTSLPENPLEYDSTDGRVYFYDNTAGWEYFLTNTSPCSIMSFSVAGCAKFDNATIDLDGSDHLQVISVPLSALPAGVVPNYVGATASPSSGHYAMYPCQISGVAQTCIEQDIDTGALNNASTTTVNLLTPFPNGILSVVCSDNSGRVQTGNTQPIGANFVGLSAPYSTFFAWAGATGENAFCIAKGW